MAIVQNAAREFFSAFEEFQGVHPDISAPEWEEYGEKLRASDKSSFYSFCDAWERFNLPSISSEQSLSSLASSANSSCSDFSEYSELLAAQNSGFTTRLFHALEKFTFSPQGHSRLPLAPRDPPEPELTFEQLSLMRKLILAFQEFVNPNLTHDDSSSDLASQASSQGHSVNPFPKFC